MTGLDVRQIELPARHAKTAIERVLGHKKWRVEIDEAEAAQAGVK